MSRVRSSRGSALMEVAIFGSIALGVLSFFLGMLASEFGALRAQGSAFRLALRHGGEDNGQFMEPRGTSGYLQIAVPSVSLQSWDLSANEGRAGGFVEWGTNLTMATANGGAPCVKSPGEPLFFGYSGATGTKWRPSQACPGMMQALDKQSTISASASASTQQNTATGTTRGTTTAGGGASLNTAFASGSAGHGVGYGTSPALTGSSNAP